MSRKRRSNRLTVEQHQARLIEQRDRDRVVYVAMIAFGQEHVDPLEAMQRSVSIDVVKRMVRDLEAEQIEVDTANGRVVMFRELKPFQGAQYRLPAMPNAACADALARSQDDGGRMTASDRRKLATVLLFPFDRDRKAPLAQRRVTDRDCRRAAELLGIRQPLPVAA